MGWIVAILGLIGLARKTEPVKAAEAIIVKRSLGLIDRLFDWVEDGEDETVVLQTAKQRIKAMIDEYGEDSLIGFLAECGIMVVRIPPVVLVPVPLPVLESAPPLP